MNRYVMNGYDHTVLSASSSQGLLVTAVVVSNNGTDGFQCNINRAASPINGGPVPIGNLDNNESVSTATAFVTGSFAPVDNGALGQWNVAAGNSPVNLLEHSGPIEMAPGDYLAFVLPTPSGGAFTVCNVYFEE